MFGVSEFSRNLNRYQLHYRQVRGFFQDSEGLSYFKKFEIMPQIREMIPNEKNTV